MDKLEHLIKYFRPDNYKLALTIDKAGRIFNGTVTITGTPLSDKIKLHAKDLTITSITDDHDRSLDWTIDGDVITIDSDPNTISIIFSGRMDETSMNGLYICKYKLGNENRELFATQFESHYARQCFPCVDEPKAKATFDVRIQTVAPDDITVLSNMPGKQGDDGWWEFATTPRMSTYLLAFAGGELISKSGQSASGVGVSVYATPAQPAAKLDYALDTAIKALDFYEDYFAVSYPLPKLDNIALPDFSAGAMENWGLITYRESAMLADQSDAIFDRSYVTTVICHEIAHQWFGNLVTMKWWDDLWLNESFASLMENIATDHIHPEYKVWLDYEGLEVRSALGADSIAGVQAVHQEINNPDEIGSLFDGAIVYAKGQRILKMLLTIIGEDKFRTGLKRYFDRFSYQNTESSDLWECLDDGSLPISIKDFMAPWINEPNFPLVTVDQSGSQLTISQHNIANLNEPTNRPVPLFPASESIPAVISEPIITVINGDNSPMINTGNAGHYLTKYSSEAMRAITANFDSLLIIDKMKLFMEASMLSRNGLQTVEQSYRLALAAQNSEDPNMIDEVGSVLSMLRRLVRDDNSAKQQLKSLICDIMGKHFDRLFNQPFDKLSIDDRKVAPLVLALCVYAKYPLAVEYRDRIYSETGDNLVAMNSHTRSVVLSSLVREKRPGVFDRLWNEYLNCQNPTLKSDLISSLTSTPSKIQASVLLQASLDLMIKPQDTIFFVSQLMFNKDTQKTTWGWIREHWSWIESVYGDDMNIDDFVKICSGSLDSGQGLAEFKAFFARVSTASIARAIKTGEQRIAKNINWLETNKPVIRDLLSQHQSQ